MMEEKITVQMTRTALFDFLLYHTYSKLSGFLVNVLGLAVGIMGILMLAMGEIEVVHFVFYIVAAMAFLLYTPLQLKHRAKKQVEGNPEYQTPKVYVFSDKGIVVKQEEKTKVYDWEKVSHTVTTPKTIGIYLDKEHAFIIPKECFGQRFVPVMMLIADHVGRQNVRLR